MSITSTSGIVSSAPAALRQKRMFAIGEYDRHNGHADLIREHLDGTTGT